MKGSLLQKVILTSSKSQIKNYWGLSVVTSTYSPSTQETKAGESVLKASLGPIVQPYLKTQAKASGGKSHLGRSFCDLNPSCRCNYVRRVLLASDIPHSTGSTACCLEGRGIR